MRLFAAAVATLLFPVAVHAHEILHELERGRATAVRAFFSDGEPLAYAAVEVYSPADPAVPHQTGRTDRSGWVAFVPDAPGAWRVKIVDDSGHGLETPASLSPLAFVLRPLVGLAVVGAVFAVLVVVRRRKGTGP